jgi:hypothetical protein
VTATAFDTAGNSATATHSLRVLADGVIVGQALADDTGLPLPGATVRMGDRTLTTDERGGYSVPATDISVVVTVAKDGMTTVERLVPVQSGVGVSVIDARLTRSRSRRRGRGRRQCGGPGRRVGVARLQPGHHDQRSGEHLCGPATLRLTALSPQGLPWLLPLGWSPLAAFDLRSAVAVSGLIANASIRSAVPAAAAGGQAPASPATVHLVEFRPSLHRGSW